MTINQLFLTKPPLELIMTMMGHLDIWTLQSVSAFSQKTIIQNNVLIKIKPILDELGKHYLPCKKRVYIDAITPKKLITIVKQCLRIYDYKLISQEKYIAGCKQIIYRIYIPPADITNHITYAEYSVSFE
jgi:hypothetical protein